MEIDVSQEFLKSIDGKFYKSCVCKNCLTAKLKSDYP